MKPEYKKVDKITISISKVNNKLLEKEDDKKSRIINKLLTKYFKKKCKKV